jgi:hypothetical protein
MASYDYYLQLVNELPAKVGCGPHSTARQMTPAALAKRDHLTARRAAG